MDGQRVAILIPAYEPDDRLVALVKELSDLKNEIVVVDDGSGEGFINLFDVVSKYATVLHHKKNEGKGAALKNGIKYCKRNGFFGVVTADSDGQHIVKDIIAIRDMVLKNPQAIILGTRSMRGGVYHLNLKLAMN